MEMRVVPDRQVASLPPLDCSMNFNGPILGRARVDMPDRSRTNMALESHGTPIYDARPILEKLSLDREGFVLLRHESGLSEACDLKEIEEDYLTSVAALLKEVTGADLVLAQGKGLLKRYSERAKQGTATPSRWVHRDYTANAAAKWIAWMEMWHAMPLRHYSRSAILQTWRCLTPPPCDNTLVLCDAQSVDPGDCIPFDACVAKPYDEPGNQFEAQLAHFNPDQRWYYFSDLRPGELIIFKGFDSDPEKFSQPFHNSIDLPDPDGCAAPRVSIEARFFAFFDNV